MRAPWVTAPAAIKARLVSPAQTDMSDPSGAMPPGLTQFLTGLRLLQGVPFDYLVANPALLPDESIRFFYLDRSWTDRLVDGVLAVGKVGSREQFHHQLQHPSILSTLDDAEPSDRGTRRAAVPKVPPAGITQTGDSETSGASDAGSSDTGGTVTGFLLRSAAVSGWPHMDVRAFAGETQLTTLRLELLSSAVMLGLFAGIPDSVRFEEPHHGIQFAIASGYSVQRSNSSVVSIWDLYRSLTPNEGSAALAVALLQAPHREIFGDAPTSTSTANTNVSQLTAGLGEVYQTVIGDPSGPVQEASGYLDDLADFGLGGEIDE